MSSLECRRASIPAFLFGQKSARALALALVAYGVTAAACGGSAPEPQAAPSTTAQSAPKPAAPTASAKTKATPPPSGTPRDIHFPPIVRTKTSFGLEINTVEWKALPVAHALLVVRSGGASDPEQLPGLAHLVASMLKEGTKKKSSAQLAEAVEFLGANFDVSSDEENVFISVHALKEHLEQAFSIVAEVAMTPAFQGGELAKLKKRELDRLSLQAKDPNFLATREFYKRLYGPHPYSHIDTTPQVVERVSRNDLVKWHKAHFMPNNAFVVVVGDVDAKNVATIAEHAFSGWHAGTEPETKYPEPPVRTAHEIVLVDRPESVQSVIVMGNLGLERANPDYVTLLVANQVLGGSAASRLFMDLRERRSLTYGAYSGIGSRVRVAPFQARASVRNAVTSEAMSAFMEHLQRIVTERPPNDELANAKRYLSDSFPLKIDTPGKIASLVADLRVFGLPDDYWESFRSSIRAVTPEQALSAAKKYIHPDKALVVVVGRASEVAEPLKKFGAVTVVPAAAIGEGETPAGKSSAKKQTKTQ